MECSLYKRHLSITLPKVSFIIVRSFEVLHRIAYTYVIQLATKLLKTIGILVIESMRISNGFPLSFCKINTPKAKSIRISLKITQHAARINQSGEEIFSSPCRSAPLFTCEIKAATSCILSVPINIAPNGNQKLYILYGNLMIGVRSGEWEIYWCVQNTFVSVEHSADA